MSKEKKEESTKKDNAVLEAAMITEKELSIIAEKAKKDADKKQAAKISAAEKAAKKEIEKAANLVKAQEQKATLAKTEFQDKKAAIDQSAIDALKDANKKQAQVANDAKEKEKKLSEAAQKAKKAKYDVDHKAIATAYMKDHEKDGVILTMDGTVFLPENRHEAFSHAQSLEDAELMHFGTTMLDGEDFIKVTANDLKRLEEFDLEQLVDVAQQKGSDISVDELRVMGKQGKDMIDLKKHIIIVSKK